MFRKRKTRENPRIAVAQALTLTRRALQALDRAVWKARSLGEEGRSLLYYIVVLQLVLERVALRLETIANTGIITRGMLATPMMLVKESMSWLKAASIDVAPLIYDIDSILTGLYETLPEPTPLGTSEIPEENKRDVQRILDEVRREAEKRVKEEIPT
jgi:hypothetical protein